MINKYRVLFARHIWHHHVVRGWANIFVLSRREYVNAYQVNFGVTVLARLRRGHLDNFARTILDENETVFAQCRTLHGKGLGGAR